MASVIRLSQFETRDIVPIVSRGPGTYLQPLLIEGNSILSSVFVKSIDVGASVLVKYFDTTTGDVPDERFDLSEHETITAAGETNRITVTSIHNKPNVEAIVTGGNVEFGVYATVVSTFATDLDAALHKHLDAIDFSRDKALPLVIRDPSDELWYFLKGTKGCLLIESTDAGPKGDGFFTDVHTTTTPGSLQTLFNISVPVSKTRRLHHLMVICRMESSYKLLAGSSIIASGRTGASTPQSSFKWNPFRSIPTGTSLKLELQTRARSPSADVEAYLMAADVDA